MAIRLILPFLTLLLLAVVEVRSRDVSTGHSDIGKKIYDQTFEASPTIWRQQQNVTVNATNGEVISGVIITDLREDKDGEAIIVEGGEGQNNVTVELKSPTAFRGYEFHVQVFAKDVAVGTDESAAKYGDNTEQSVNQATGQNVDKMPIMEPAFTNSPPAKLGKENVKEINTTENPKESTKNEEVPKGSSNIQSSKVEDTHELRDVNAKDELRPIRSSNDSDKLEDSSTVQTKNAQDNLQTSVNGEEKTIGSTESPKTIGTQQQAQESQDYDQEAPMINGQGLMYANGQPKVNGQLIRAERDTNGLKQGDFTSEPELENESMTESSKSEKTESDNTARGILGLAPFDVKAGANGDAKNLETLLQESENEDSQYIHKIPRPKSAGDRKTNSEESSQTKSVASSQTSSETSSPTNRDTSSQGNSGAYSQTNSAESSPQNSDSYGQTKRDTSHENIGSSSPQNSDESCQANSDASRQTNSYSSSQTEADASSPTNSDASSQRNNGAYSQIHSEASSTQNSDFYGQTKRDTSNENIDSSSPQNREESFQANSDASRQTNSYSSSQTKADASSPTNSDASSQRNNGAYSQIHSEASSTQNSDSYGQTKRDTSNENIDSSSPQNSEESFQANSDTSRQTNSYSSSQTKADASSQTRSDASSQTNSDANRQTISDQNEQISFANPPEIESDRTKIYQSFGSDKIGSQREARDTKEDTTELNQETPSIVDGKSNFEAEMNEKQNDTNEMKDTDLNKGAIKDDPKSPFVPLKVARRDSESSSTNNEDPLKKKDNLDVTLRATNENKTIAESPKIPVPVTSID